MADREKFTLQIYCGGVVRNVSIRGRHPYGQMKEFLNDLTAQYEARLRCRVGNAEIDWTFIFWTNSKTNSFARFCGR
jgi:hypothetical protein